MIWGKRKLKIEKDKIKEEGTKGGETRRRRKGGKDEHKEKNEEHKEKEEKKRRRRGALERKREKGEKRRRGGDKLDINRSIKLDSMNIKFRSCSNQHHKPPHGF